MAAATKVAANAGISVIIELLTEQLHLTGRYGVPEAKLVEVLLGVDYGNRLIRSYGSIIAERRFEPVGFPLVLGRKDVGLALDAAKSDHLPLVSFIAERMDSIIASGKGERDWATLEQLLPS